LEQLKTHLSTNKTKKPPQKQRVKPTALQQ